MTEWFEKDWSMVNCFYFGCMRTGGHYAWTPGGHKISSNELPGPWGSAAAIDGRLAPKSNEQRQFEAKLHKKDGWTAIAFWDRTIDDRLNSNSAFFVDSDLSFEQIVEIFCRKFPMVVNRMGTTPVLYTGD